MRRHREHYHEDVYDEHHRRNHHRNHHRNYHTFESFFPPGSQGANPNRSLRDTRDLQSMGFTQLLNISNYIYFPRDEVAKEIIKRLKVDSEINPNRLSIIQILDHFSSNEQYILDWLDHPRIDLFTDKTYLPKFSDNIIEKLRLLGVSVHRFSVSNHNNFGSLNNFRSLNNFGYFHDIFDRFKTNNSDLDSLAPVHIIPYLGNRTKDSLQELPVEKSRHQCVVCLEKIKKNNIKLGRCNARVHHYCGFAFVISYIKSLTHSNPLEKAILPCPCGCRKEITPSLIHSVKEYFESSENIMVYLSKLKKPKRFIKDNLDNFKLLSQTSLEDLNKNYLFVRFKGDVRFSPCPDESCHGFALIDPEIEVQRLCSHCFKNKLFVGQKILQQREALRMATEKNRDTAENKEAIEVFQRYAAKNMHPIRPCPTCGKLVEKIGGCNQMTCPLGHVFKWVQAVKIDDEGKLHF